MIDTITKGIYITLAVIVVAFVVFYIWFMMKQKQKESGKISQGTMKSSSNKSSSALKDTKEFIKEIEDIRDGILITDNGTRYIMAITCAGVGDFYDQSASEQLSVMRGYKGFVNTINSPITYKLYPTELDMDFTVNKYVEKREEYLQKYKIIETTIARLKQIDSEEYMELMREKEMIARKIRHIAQQLEGVQFYSSSSVAMEQRQEYVFDWKYSSSDFDKDLTMEERFVRAKAELEVIASSKIAALSSAGVKARVCTQGEIIDACRRVSQPISVERFRQKDIEASAFFEDIVTSDSMEGMSYVVAEDLLAGMGYETEGFLSSGTPSDETNKDEKMVLGSEGGVTGDAF